MDPVLIDAGTTESIGEDSTKRRGVRCEPLYLRV